jgi:phospholipase D1/2
MTELTRRVRSCSFLIFFWSLNKSIFFCVRRADSYIKEMEQISGVGFYDAEVAQARRWIGDSWGPGTEKEVKVIEVQKNYKKNDVKTKTVRMPESLNAANDVIEKFESASLQIRDDEYVSNTVGQHAMIDQTTLGEEKWLGTEEEERDA